MCYHHQRKCIVVPKSTRAILNQPITARISDDGRCFFGRNAVGLKDFCGAGEING
jgi:hypothetical protein